MENNFTHAEALKVMMARSFLRELTGRINNDFFSTVLKLEPTPKVQLDILAKLDHTVLNSVDFGIFGKLAAGLDLVGPLIHDLKNTLKEEIIDLTK